MLTQYYGWGFSIPREKAREIALAHGIDFQTAEDHRNAVWAGMQGKGPERLKAVNEIWEKMDGSACYYDAALAMARALVVEE